MLTGSSSSGSVSLVYRNDSPISANTPPEAPTNLVAQVDGSTVTFSWDAATDAQTPSAGLTYNLRMGTTAGGNEISSAMSDGSGYRHIPALGNTNHNTSWTVELPEQLLPSFYWSVQAVDACFAGSAFAQEQLVFVLPGFVDIGASLLGVNESSVAWGDYDNDGDLDILLTGSTNSGYVSLVYHNHRPNSANTPPAAPTNLVAQVDGSTVTFNWDAATDAETPSTGLTYNLRMGTTPGGNEISSAMSDGSGYRHIPALGNTNHNTSWTVELPEQVLPAFYWSVQAVDTGFAGSEFADELKFPLTSGVPDQPLPKNFSLLNNVPNPFNPVTTISYDLPSSENVRLSVFDVSGRLVRVLLNGQKISAGHHQVQWDGRDNRNRQVSSGVYLYRLEAGSFHETRRMVLTK